MWRSIVWCGMASLVYCGGVAAAPESSSTSTPDSGVEKIIQGEVVDPAAYLKAGQRGAAVSDETYEAVDAGQTPALLEESTNRLYLLLADGPGDDPGALVYDYMNQRVKIKGRVYQRGGLNGIVLTQVEPLDVPVGATPPLGQSDDQN